MSIPKIKNAKDIREYDKEYNRSLGGYVESDYVRVVLSRVYFSAKMLKHSRRGRSMEVKKFVIEVLHVEDKEISIEKLIRRANLKEGFEITIDKVELIKKLGL